MRIHKLGWSRHPATKQEESEARMSSKKLRGRKPNITMSEIAQMAGVSQSTVSRVLTGTTPVAPDKQAAVLEVIERLNFHPNVSAQSLVHGRTFQIGDLTRHPGSPS